MKNSVSLRIGLIIKHLNLNVNSFSKAIGLTNNVTIGRIISEEREPGYQVLSKILTTFGSINANWLITGEGEMFLRLGESRETSELLAVLPKPDNSHEELQDVPLYNVEKTVGLIGLFSTGNKHIIDHIHVPDLPHCDGAVHVTGDNMYPLLKSGDIVLYKKVYDLINDIFWGEMYLISIEANGEEYISVKYIQKSEMSDHIKLVSYNEHHQPKDIHQNKIRALALVKASIRINSML